MQNQSLSKQSKKLLEISLLSGLKSKLLRDIAIFAKEQGSNAIEDNDKMLQNFGINLNDLAKNRHKYESILEKCGNSNISIISYLDDDYPESLKKISDFPPILYVRGSIQSLSTVGCSVIGTRKASKYGIKLAEKISDILVENKYSVISGLALGIDAAAHKMTVQKRGIAVAVMAHGLEKVLPKSNQNLGSKIIDGGGALVSEYPPDTAIQKHYFIRRNRIQSGLSICTILVESASEGGSMHHANFAFNQGKRVFCIVPEPSKKYGKLDTSGAKRLVSEDKAVQIADSTELLQALSCYDVQEQKVESVAKEKVKVFVSYSWDSDSHKQRVKSLCDKLKGDGVEVFADCYLKRGANLSKFMTKNLTNSEKCIIVCTKKYTERVKSGQSAGTLEDSLILPEKLKNFDKKKIIPVFMDNPKKHKPSSLKSLTYFDFNTTKNSDSEYSALLDAINDTTCSNSIQSKSEN